MKTLVCCPTYGRIPFLNRMLASFLSQTYDDKHLVIVNDDINVNLECEEKNVTCINMNRKYLLPQKRNIGFGINYDPILMNFDDDDIFLPKRIENHVKQHELHPEMGMYFKPGAYMIYDKQFSYSYCSRTANSQLRSTWHSVGGYSSLSNTDEDQQYFNKMTNVFMDNVEDPDYVYNYGGINYHASNATPASVDEIAYRQLQELNLVGKKYMIEPDYEEFNKFVLMDEMFRQNKQKIQVEHIGLGKTNIKTPTI